MNWLNECNRSVESVGKHVCGACRGAPHCVYSSLRILGFGNTTLPQFVGGQQDGKFMITLPWKGEATWIPLSGRRWVWSCEPKPWDRCSYGIGSDTFWLAFLLSGVGSSWWGALLLDGYK